MAKKPCNECPWRRKALPGWLGGNDASVYADSVQSNQIPPCHKTQTGPGEGPHLCTGALICSRNACIRPMFPDAAPKEADLVERSADVFAHPAEFYRHHTGEEYVSPMLRMIAQMEDEDG